MKKLFFNLIALIGFASLTSCGYNSMVDKETAVEAQWAQVENVYQRRADLIPNLVNTVKGSAEFVKSTLTDVIKARAEATSVKINADKLTPENIQKYQQAQDGLTSALGKLMVVSEQYPDIRTNQFDNLMTELEGTENRIAVERRKFNEAVQDYNAYIRRFPNNLTAGMFGFEKKGYFTAQPGAEKAPTVDFNTK
jgi:LemA protein